MIGAAALTLVAMMFLVASVLNHNASEVASTARARVVKSRFATWTGLCALIALFVALGLMG